MLENFTLEEDNSKRYKKVNKPQYIPYKEYIYGCEFEFYLYDHSLYEEIKEKLFEISHKDLLTNDMTAPRCKDSDECMHLKPDISLGDNGLEISIPKSSYKQLQKYIMQINSLIGEYGYTDNDTGLHIHISTKKTNGIKFDFFKFSLLCNEVNLFDSWSQRNDYCLNVMDIIQCNNKQDSRKLKNKKGKVWNLELISNNRIEIRTMGGIDYHNDNEKIFNELKLFKDLFIETLAKPTPEYIVLEKKHLDRIKTANLSEQKKFMEIFN